MFSNAPHNDFDVFVVITRRELDNWAWVAASYPGFVEHRAVYWIAASLLMVIAVVIALGKMNTLSFIRAMVSTPVPFRKQAVFLTGFTALLFVSSVFFVRGNCFLNLYGKGMTIFGTALLAAFLLSIALFMISTRQWRYMEGKNFNGYSRRLLYSLFFSIVPVLIVISTHILLWHSAPSAELIWFWREYLYVFQSYKVMAIAISLFFTLGGFLLGYGITLTACEDSTPPGIRGETLTFTVLILTLFACGILGGIILKKRYHFFINPQKLFSLEERMPDPRKVVIFGPEGSFREVGMGEKTTCFTVKNMEHLESYLAHTRHRTRYTHFAYSRLIDYHILNWDIPAALDSDARRIREHQDNNNYINGSLWVLRNSKLDPKLKSLVDYYADERLFAFPGFDSCARMACVLNKYGEKAKAEAFLNKGMTRPRARERYARWMSWSKSRGISFDGKEEPGKMQGRIAGIILHRGRPLSGVKVRIFPVSHMVRRMNEKQLDPFEYAARQIGYERDRLYSTYCFAIDSQPSDLVRLYNMYAVTGTDASGRFSFDNLPCDQYILAIMLEGEAAHSSPSGNPGILSVTSARQEVIIPAIELE